MTATAIRPTESAFFANHSTEALRDVVERYTAQSAAMVGSPLADEAMRVANAAWFELATREAAAKRAAA